MNNDYLEVENADGMPGLVDSTLAMDFLIAAKSGVRTCAIAISECSSPEVRSALTTVLDDAIDLYSNIADLMLKKGLLHPYDLQQQFEIDNISSKTAMQIAKLELFPGNTSRLGTFATPNY